MNARMQKIANDILTKESMACCDAVGLAELSSISTKPVASNNVAPTIDPTAYVVEGADGISHLNLLVENLHCAACISTIENRLLSEPSITKARVNMSTRRLSVSWRTGALDPISFMQAIGELGYPLVPFDPNAVQDMKSREERRLISALAVAGFASANVMLLSVSIWSGHAGGMGEGTRTLFHWISALIALPAIVYAGQPFFQSAYGAIRRGALNMDVPISLAVVLASLMSVYQTYQNSIHAYFDAAIMLLFFLLIGRFLDFRARAKACSAATHLLALQGKAAMVIDDNGLQHAMRPQDVVPGMKVFIAAGERIPVDGDVIEGTSEIDVALITGESMPKLAEPSGQVFAGTLNLNAPLIVKSTAHADATLLSEIVRLMETAEQGRARYVRLADRVARYYAPTVHLLAAVTFIGWMMFGDVDWIGALMASIAVLIITCPCALGLAVPAVQVVASGRLLRSGILVKSADALERLAEIDTVVFDKTGTLTIGNPELTGGDYDDEHLKIASALAAHSRHPLSRALAKVSSETGEYAFADICEVPGYGLEGTLNGAQIRLGSADWCDNKDAGASGSKTEVFLAIGGEQRASFHFNDALRPDAQKVIETLSGMGFHVALLSGDRCDLVGEYASQLKIEDWRGECLPRDKTAYLEMLAACGQKTLMVGDGLNDAPSLVAAHVSMSPSSAADISQTASDFIFQGMPLGAVVTAIRVAKTATRLVKQNFALAFLYNTIAVPLAMFGFVTPLIAAVAMSSSSLVVTLNAIRLRVLK